MAGFEGLDAEHDSVVAEAQRARADASALLVEHEHWERAQVAANATGLTATHRVQDADEDGEDDEHARRNKSPRGWMPTIVADCVLCVLLVAVLIAGARVDGPAAKLELPDPYVDDEDAA